MNRRQFLRQSFAFSAMSATASLSRVIAAPLQHKDARNWFLVGDWGAERFEAQSKVAEAMQAYIHSQGIKADALMLLGDNWYGDMTGGVDSPRWKRQFEDMYPVSTFDCKAYALLGNHDYQRIPTSKVDIELAYAKRGGTRWTQPDRWYTFQFPAEKPLATVIVLDSNVSRSDRPPVQGVNFTLTDDEHEEQLRWLEKELAKPRSTPYLIVMAHHPVYSNGPHGDHPVLIERWEPLLRKHQVHLYFAGHDHDMQHLEFEGHPTSFVLSGGGGADLYTLKIEEADRGPSARKIHGFTHLEMNEAMLTVRHLDDAGNQIHAFTKTSTGVVRILS